MFPSIPFKPYRKQSMKNKLRCLQFCAALTLCAAAVHPAVAGPSDNSLRWASNNMPANLDFYTHNLREGIVLAHQIWDTLVYRNPKTGELEPNLAQSYRVIDDKTLEFTLRRGVKFHNGVEMTADDVVATVQYVTTHPTPQPVSFLARAEKIDDYTVLLHLKEPFPPALEYLANILPIYPKQYYAEVGPEGMGRQPIGTGPYRVTEVVLGNSVKMQAFEDYFAAVKSKPAIQIQEFRRIPEFNTQVLELMTGALDWIWRVPSDTVPRLKSNSALKIQAGQLMRIAFMPMDALGRSGNSPLQDRRVRQAINHAVNREAIRAALMGEGSELINAICSPVQFGCTEEDVVVYDYNPQKAKQLLAEAGYPDGFTVEAYAYRDRPIFEAVMGDLGKVGITLNLNWLQPSTLLKQIGEGKTAFQFHVWGSLSIRDAYASIGYWYDGGDMDYARNPRVLELLKGDAYSLDPETRKAAYREALGIVSKEAYAIPLFNYNLNYAYHKDLVFTPTPDEVPQFFEAAWK